MAVNVDKVGNIPQESRQSIQEGEGLGLEIGFTRFKEQCVRDSDDGSLSCSLYCEPPSNDIRHEKTLCFLEPFIYIPLGDPGQNRLRNTHFPAQQLGSLLLQRGNGGPGVEMPY